MTESVAVMVRPTRAGRLVDYLGEMFPLTVHVPFGVATFLAVYLGLGALVGQAPLALPWRAWLGAVTVVLFLLLLRVYDELKDVETDLRLGRAGDPRYKDRAVVTGRVRVDDIVFLRRLVTALLVVTNLAMGAALPIAAFALVFLVTWLSFKWFFWPAISKNLLLAFATHNPMTALLVVYIAAVFAADFELDAPVMDVLALTVSTWFPVAAWETSRKVRRAEDETDYQTYSMLLGQRVAAILPALFVVMAAIALTRVSTTVGLGVAFLAIVYTMAGVVVLGCLRFVVRPTTASANLKPFAEAYSLVATVGFVVALIVAHGIRVSVP